MWVTNSFPLYPFYFCSFIFYCHQQQKSQNEKFSTGVKALYIVGIKRYPTVNISTDFFLDKSDNIRANSCVFSFSFFYCRYMIVLLKWQLMWVWTFFYIIMFHLFHFLIGKNERSPHRKWKRFFFSLLFVCVCAFSLV